MKSIVEAFCDYERSEFSFGPSMNIEDTLFQHILGMYLFATVFEYSDVPY